jgi:hypothetical protein
MPVIIRRQRRVFRVFLAVLAALLPPAFAATSAAAAQITGGAILGIVKDTTDSVIPGATVTATNVATNQSSVTHTNADG